MTAAGQPFATVETVYVVCQVGLLTGRRSLLAFRDRASADRMAGFLAASRPAELKGAATFDTYELPLVEFLPGWSGPEAQTEAAMAVIRGIALEGD